MSFSLNKWRRSLNTLPLPQLKFSQLCFHLLNINSGGADLMKDLMPLSSLSVRLEHVSRPLACASCLLFKDRYRSVTSPTGLVMIVRIGWLSIGLIVIKLMRRNGTRLLIGIRKDFVLLNFCACKEIRLWL